MHTEGIVTYHHHPPKYYKYTVGIFPLNPVAVDSEMCHRDYGNWEPVLEVPTYVVVCMLLLLGKIEVQDPHKCGGFAYHHPTIRVKWNNLLN